ncbi:MBL fold metallo-hydrolase [Polaromonas sp. P1(28)-13]|nr:MBL fold metallo-hydrolase [Polaromonas sp. P1-6]UUZ77720.1 MBL fold metallo-hydrolase [Polaromonas sp. P1(28)-13]
MNHSFPLRPLPGILAFSAALARRLALPVLVLAGVGALQGCGANDAQAQARKGAQATPWGMPYSNMPEIVPPNVRADAYTPLTDAQMGPPIDPLKGYRIDNLGGGVYTVGDGIYSTMFVVSDVGVILVDAPPTLGPKILKAIQEVASGASIVALIYSHAHIDHIGYASEVVKTNPAMQIVAHEETRKSLAFAKDPNRPVPKQSFNTLDIDFPLVVGNQTLQLRFPGPNHDPGNIGIYHPGQKVLMLVDVVYPGWMMWRRMGLATDIPGYFALVKSMNTRWDFDKLVSGHFFPGTKADVSTQFEFMTDLHNAVTEAISTVPYDNKSLNAADAKNPWAATRDWTDRLTNHCVNKVSGKWASRLAAYEVWIYEQCQALEQSIRIDGPSLK